MKMSVKKLAFHVKNLHGALAPAPDSIFLGMEILKDNADGSIDWVLGTHMGNLGLVLGSQLHP